MLFEKNALGAGQTLAAQGIIHSGIKYSFDGIVRSHTQTLAAMPKVWMDSISGVGKVDLRRVEILANHQIVFTVGGITSRIAAALASKTLGSALGKLDRSEFPEVFCAKEFTGQVYRLEEPVLATKTLLAALQDQAQGGHCVTFSARLAQLIFEDDRVAEVVFADDRRTRIRPRACVFSAGEGNEWFAEQAGFKKITQRRPLRMFMARGLPHKLYAHWLLPEPQPRITVTTHELNGENVWYIGGSNAEKTAVMDLAESLDRTRVEMTRLFPWLNWKRFQWAIYEISGAEPEANQLLTGGPQLTVQGNAALAWPTKLALAPALGDQIIEWLKVQNIPPSYRTTELSLPPASIDLYPWEKVHEWRRL